jgi:putative mRNA 3-end processing factor
VRAAHGRIGGQQILLSERALGLLGPAREALGARALVADYGRPFVLGDLRLELFPAGHAPGAASLLCEQGGRRIVYAGPVLPRAPGALTARDAEVRPAHALCVDATFAAPHFVFPPRLEAVERAVRFAEDALARGRHPVFLVPAGVTALELLGALGHRGLGPRAHPAILRAAATFAAAGVAVPIPRRFGRHLSRGEVLLWPPEGREAAALSALASPTFAFVSGHCLDPAQHARMRADAGIALANVGDFNDLLAYVRATGATEVATVRGHAEAFAAALAKQGHDAYALGPPAQMPLFPG